MRWVIETLRAPIVFYRIFILVCKVWHFTLDIWLQCSSNVASTCWKSFFSISINCKTLRKYEDTKIMKLSQLCCENFDSDIYKCVGWNEKKKKMFRWKIHLKLSWIERTSSSHLFQTHFKYCSRVVSLLFVCMT